METPASFVNLIETWPDGPAGIAADLGVKAGLPPIWKHRGTIPASYWRDLVAAAGRRGVPGVTLDLLAHFAAERRAA